MHSNLIGSSLRSQNLPSSAQREFAEQRNANASALGHFDSFASHRSELTERVCQSADGRKNPRLCVLGAGNCFDLDLKKITALYSEVHLVDIDWRALKGAYARASANARTKLHCHAPVELSGILGRLERWRLMDVSVDEALSLPTSAAQKIAEQLPGPFDVVVSACLLTQLQLAILRVLPDNHPLFEAARQTTNLTHLRSLYQLVAPGGRAILATDVTCDSICSRERLESSDLATLLGELERTGKLFHAVKPGLLSVMCDDDPWLKRGMHLNAIRKPWLWRNGPERLLLVCALEFDRS